MEVMEERAGEEIWGIRLRAFCAAVLCVGCMVAVWASRGWGLSGDSALMHYVVFLMRGGMVPYREIAEVNLPGTYLFEWAGMTVFGDGAVGWRVYDLALLLAGAGACFAVAGRRRWFAAVFAAGMFALVHLQDGIPEGGQRDLLVAVLLLWALVPLLKAVRSERVVVWSLVFGMVMRVTFTVKPVLLPMSLAALGMLAWMRGWRVLWAGMVGMAVPVGLAVLWLVREGALGAFWRDAVPLIRLHAGIGVRPLGFLLAHCVSPVTVLFAVWCGMLVVRRERWRAERVLLVVAFVGAVVGYVAQGKGFTYQRYPELAVLLVGMGLEFDEGLRELGARWWLAAVACVVGCLVFAPRWAWLTTTFSPKVPFAVGLQQELETVGLASELDGQVQCLDTFGGCVAEMYALRLRQSTGFLYDCYLFEGAGAEQERYRAAFWAAYVARRPRVLVVTDQLCFRTDAPEAKIRRWPQLAEDVARSYDEGPEWTSTEMDHFWKRFEEPTKFRLYVRKGTR
jgi:hypothetical protein